VTESNSPSKNGQKTTVAQSQKRWLQLVSPLLTVAVLGFLVGCGDSGSSGSDTSEAHGPDTVVVEALQSGTLDVEALYDGSASRGSEPLIQQSMATVGNAFELTVAAGGSFSAKMVRGDLATADLVSPASIPSPDSASDEIERSEVASSTRSEISTATERLLKDRSVPGLRGGSAIAYNLRQAIDGAATRSDPGTQSVIVVVTDGVDDSVKGHLGEQPQVLAKRLSASLGSGGGDGDVILLAGIGTAKGGAPSAAANRLASAWQMACEKTGAQCAVSVEVESPVLLEAFENA
jgi:hypothetical protein